MRYSTAVFVFLIFAAAVSVTAQRKTITNADLEKYRQARLAAERDYRENYARLGMPSPEELARRDEASRKELSELSARLREEERMREQLELQNSRNRSSVVVVNRDRSSYDYGVGPALVTGFYGFGRYNGRRFGYRQPYQPTYYVSGGSIWPIVPRTTPQPQVRIRKR